MYLGESLISYSTLHQTNRTCHDCSCLLRPSVPRHTFTVIMLLEWFAMPILLANHWENGTPRDSRVSWSGLAMRAFGRLCLRTVEKRRNRAEKCVNVAVSYHLFEDALCKLKHATLARNMARPDTWAAMSFSHLASGWGQSRSSSARLDEAKLPNPWST